MPEQSNVVQAPMMAHNFFVRAGLVRCVEGRFALAGSIAVPVAALRAEQVRFFVRRFADFEPACLLCAGPVRY